MKGMTDERRTEKPDELPDLGSPQVRTLYRMRAAAKLVGIGYPALMGAAKAGTLRTVRVGRDYRVTAQALNDFVERLEEKKVRL